MASGGALLAHADWSVSPEKRWMAVARRSAAGWTVAVRPVGEPGSLLVRLRDEADGGRVVLGIDAPIGLPRDYAAAHAGGAADFPAFLRALEEDALFFAVCDEAAEIGPSRPFYPRRARAGVARRVLFERLGLADASALYRACDCATGSRRRAAALFWTVGANQVGKAALSVWGRVLRPALAGAEPPALWPFEGGLHALMAARPVTVAETYPAEAAVQLGLRLGGSKRSRAARRDAAGALLDAAARLGAAPDAALGAAIRDGFGATACGEDRFDCVIGLLGLLRVVAEPGRDNVPDDPAIRHWEGWILGQG